ncbi:LuxR C-terminal-related transcriptional regulator [Bosea sp. (in: a-proteobacteria)]|uniref:helix-turn-helix transcriptional regulator n=1 Tax=Bosea sp. (in: a-proteobacteria) TaxID=1871050 RepID=UPI002626EC4B|nr:LuxR C-terminal-related transcriptional regulator [Bosea sp. (in: a-proteobacteria)]MCO5091650.1 LuxR C-terminal-related transcriptional regulator [Bosea sp. (in: a-proteobacteria)]
MSFQVSIPGGASFTPFLPRPDIAPDAFGRGSRPVFVIDAALNLHFGNCGAAALARDGLGGGERFTARDKEFMARLTLWLKRCRNGAAAGETRLPLSLGSGRQIAVDAVHLASIGLFVLTVDDPESAIDRNIARVGEACGLTPTEERMLALMAEGLDTITAARRLGIATTTARTHLQRLFAKTGTARQSELVRFVAIYVAQAR